MSNLIPFKRVKIKECEIAISKLEDIYSFTDSIPEVDDIDLTTLDIEILKLTRLYESKLKMYMNDLKTNN